MKKCPTPLSSRSKATSSHPRKPVDALVAERDADANVSRPGTLDTVGVKPRHTAGSNASKIPLKAMARRDGSPWSVGRSLALTALTLPLLECTPKNRKRGMKQRKLCMMCFQYSGNCQWWNARFQCFDAARFFGYR